MQSSGVDINVKDMMALQKARMNCKVTRKEPVGSNKVSRSASRVAKCHGLNKGSR